MGNTNTLSHLAIIMDGNGRWAQNKGLPRRDGHKEGAKVVRQITTWCAQNSICYLTLYAFSTENWKRPKAEVEFLMQLLRQYLKNEKNTYVSMKGMEQATEDVRRFTEEAVAAFDSLHRENAFLRALLLELSGRKK